MGGGILQMVSNYGPQNIWLDHNPQITLFKKIYRRHTPFVLESIRIPLNAELDFGSSGSAKIKSLGDLVYRVFFVCDIPQLAAAFLNTKSQDLLSLFNNACLSDDVFGCKIKQYLKNAEDVELVSIINIVDETLRSYDEDQNDDLEIIKLINTNLLSSNDKSRSVLTDLQGISCKADQKMDLIEILVSQKKEYYLIYQLIKLIYQSNKEIIPCAPVINTLDIGNTLLYSSIFSNILPNKEILTLFYLKNLNISNDFPNVLNNLNNNLLENNSNYQYLSNIYCSQANKFIINNPHLDFINCDSVHLEDPLCNAADDFYDFGPSYHYVLNSYNIIINVINSLAKTIPIIVIKPFNLANNRCENVDIYNDTIPTIICEKYYQTIIDPNFKSKFILSVADINKPIDKRFTCSGYPDNVDDENNICSNKYQNKYLTLFNDHAFMMFDNIRKMMDKLFEVYRISLFSTTQTLFYNNIPPLNYIYSYNTPIDGFEDRCDKRIHNVFNTNIWFFYFFKYLDTFNGTNFTNYIQQNTPINMSYDGMLIMKNIIVLLKINIDYYMHEISYLLNDLYQNCPSEERNDTMKNYVPVSFSEKLDCVDIHHDLLAVTFIFHRNHVPTILEMFQYIYHFVDNISMEKISKYLKLKIKIIPVAELLKIREIIKLFYSHVFGYFMDIYDNTGFEPPACYITGQSENLSQTNLSQVIVRYISHYFRSDPISIGPDQDQISLRKTISQMEFYFVAEFLHMRELQKFYHNILFNKSLLLANVGSTTADLITMTTNYFFATDNNYKLDIVALKKIPCPTKTYYDLLYQHNARNNMPDNLYYSIFNLDRYSGKPYLNTPYESRNFGLIPKNIFNATIQTPLPLPPTDPYGINLDYFDNNQNNLFKKEIPVYWTSSSIRIEIDTNRCVSENNNFQLFEIDYFRIKHCIFYKKNIIPHIKFVDQYQLNLLMLLRYVERLKNIYPATDEYLFYWIRKTLDYLLRNTNTCIIYQNSLRLFNFSTPCLTMFEVLDMLYYYITKYFDGPDTVNIINTIIPPGFLDECCNMVTEMFVKFNNGIQIKQYNQFVPYNYSDLLTCNCFVYNEIYGSINVNHNILENIRIIKNNFVAQYFYYVKNQCAIKNIYDLQLINETCSHKNISEIISIILGTINQSEIDIDLLKNISTLVYICPDVCVSELSKILDTQKGLDDFGEYISNLLITVSLPVAIQRITCKDIIDTINLIFNSASNIYKYCLVNCQLDHIIPILERFQILFLAKQELFSTVEQYLNQIRNQPLTELDAQKISQIVVSYGINYEEYYQYLVDIFLPYYNGALIDSQQQIYYTYKLRSELDFYFIKWKCRDFNINFGITFKEYIISLIFVNEYEIDHPLLKTYFNFIDNQYYSYILCFINYAQNISDSPIKNPLFSHNWRNLGNDVSKKYNSFAKIINVLEYCLDIILDLSLQKYNLYDENKPSFVINNILPNHPTNQTDNQTNNQTDRVQHIIDALNSGNLENVRENVCENYLTNINKLNSLADIVREILEKEIFLIERKREEILHIKNQIYNIFYRNKIAKTAWIRKLAHFLIKEVSFKANDQEVDLHISDWLESFHEISKNNGSEYGYNKMIGNREDLIIFDNELKKSYTIVMPLIFYFNHYVALAVPLNASLNTNYEITIKLRTLEEVTYKEQFSDFIDPSFYCDIGNPNIKPFKPKLKNTCLMVEYIYLAAEERRIFSTNMLEYLIREIQFDNGLNITDNNLIPVYNVSTNHKKEYLVDQNKLDPSQINNLRPRNDSIVSHYVNKNGIISSIMVNQPLPIDEYIWYKKIDHRYYFNNPTELMIVLIKPNIHTHLTLRTDEKYYFFGEHQWDNYGLYSYYNLSSIVKVKKNYYEKLRIKLNDPDDPQFGFINLLNHLLLDSTFDNLIDNKIDKWINCNKCYFLETLQKIKDAYMTFNYSFINIENLIRFKENITSLSLNYPINNIDHLFTLVTKVCIQLELDLPTQDIIIRIYSKIIPCFDINNFIISKDFFRDGIIELLCANQYDIIFVDANINKIYKIYNDFQINLLIMEISSLIDFCIADYNFINIIDCLFNLYLIQTCKRDEIIKLLAIIRESASLLSCEKINNMNRCPINNIFYKNIIYQIFPTICDTKDLCGAHVSYDAIKIVTVKMNRLLNKMVDQYCINLVDYKNLIVENPKINPLVKGFIKFDSFNIMPENSSSKMWSEVPSYLYLKHTPSTGINMHLWSLYPLSNQISGTINLSMIHNFSTVYYVHPLIGNSYPAEIVTIVRSVNIMRYLSGLCGKAWK